MEPLSNGIRLPEILLDRQSREPLHEQIKTKWPRQFGTATCVRLQAAIHPAACSYAYESLAAGDLIHNVHGSGAHVNELAPLALPPMTSLLSAAMYPELVTLFADPDGNPFYLRHPDRR